MAGATEQESSWNWMAKKKRDKHKNHVFSRHEHVNNQIKYSVLYDHDDDDSYF